MSDRILAGGEEVASRYRVDSYIGEGGMQQVYRAIDTHFDRIVALKVPKNRSAQNRFARSAQMSARVNHAHVAKTLDYFTDDTRSYLIEEFVDGVDLGRLLDERFKVLDPHLAARVIHHLSTGLAAAHHAKVFHRDLKPSNIMASSDPSLSRLKLTDFGIARLAEEELTEAIQGGQDTITTSQTALGALPYMAPEMIDRPAEAGLPADIWAFGAILYRLVSGLPPFGTGLRAVPAILEAKVPPKPPLFDKHPQFAPLTDDLWEIMEWCMQKDPTKRPSADQLVGTCAKLCYANTPRVEGTIRDFGQYNGAFGFISDSEYNQVFFHADCVYGAQAKPGLRVNFSVFPGNPRARAYPVLALLKP